MAMSEYFRNIRSKVGKTLLQMPAVTIANFDHTERFLLVKHRDTKLWVLPGGAIEPGETPAHSALREMWEETGLIVELVRILGVFGGPEFVVTYSNGDQVSYVTTVFESLAIGGELNPVDDESLDFAYFTAEEIVGLDTQPWVQVVLPDIVKAKKDGQAHFRSSSWRP